MTYDPIDTNDDGVVDADVDNQSVNTERGSIKSRVLRVYGIEPGTQTYEERKISDYADASAAINQALADADELHGCKIELPFLDETISEKIDIIPSIGNNETFKPWEISGVGSGMDIFEPHGTQFRSTLSGTAIAAPDESPYGHSVRLSGISLQGSGSETEPAIVWYGQDATRLEHITVDEVGQTAFEVDVPFMAECVVRGAANNQNGAGIDIRGDGEYRNCEVEIGRPTSSAAIKVGNQADGTRIFGSNTEGSEAQDGIFVDSTCSRIQLEEGKFFNNSRWGVFWKAQSGVIRNIQTQETGTNDGNGSGGINLSEATDTTVRDCLLLEDDGPHINVGPNCERIAIYRNTFNGTGAEIDLSGDATDVYNPTINGGTITSWSNPQTLSFDCAFSSLENIELDITVRGTTGDFAQPTVVGLTTNADGNVRAVDVKILDTSGAAASPSQVYWKANPINVTP